LPKVARLAGFWLGKGRMMMASVKAEIQQELHAEEIRQVLKDQSQDVEQLLDKTTHTANALQASLQKQTPANSAKMTPPNEPK
jgi:sec-independent protein translocase protein TatB